MSDTWFVRLFAITVLFFAAFSVVLMLWPSAFLRSIRNPLQPDTPINRVYMRAGAIPLFLFVLLAISGAFTGFHRNIMLALSVSPVTIPAILWLLWRYSSLQRVNRNYLTGDGTAPQWELRMSILFSVLLVIIVASALILASRGIYPKW